ncbi:MAG: adenylate kinase [bacterium]|nr:adenylate kinase [bacterium]
MELIFIGYPGSGKGTQAALLSQHFGNIPKISTGDILRAAVAAKTDLGMKAKLFMDAGELVPDYLIIDMVVQRISEPDSAKGYILDGFPRNIHQAQELDRVLLNHRRPIAGVLSLEIEKKKVIERLTSRRVCSKCGHLFNLISDPPPANNICSLCKGQIYQRSDDKPETVLHRMEVYEEATRPLKSYYGSQGKLIPIDGSLSIEKVQAEIINRLTKALAQFELWKRVPRRYTS